MADFTWNQIRDRGKSPTYIMSEGRELEPVRSWPFGEATPWRPVVSTPPASITEATRSASHPGSPSRCRSAAYFPQAPPRVSASGAPVAPGSAPLVTFPMDGLPASQAASAWLR